MKQGWTYKKLGDVCDIYQPKTLSTEDLIDDGKYPVYGANGVIGRYNSYNHDSPEVLLTCRGATCGRINISQPFSWINGNAMVIHRKSDVLSFDFLKYIMSSLDYSLIITGAAQPQITRQKLAPTVISYPSLSEQKSIVSELDRINELISLKKAQLNDLDALAQSIFYEMFGDPIENNKGWEVKLLGTIAEFKNGLNFSKGESGNSYKFLGVSDFQNNKTVLSSSLCDIHLTESISNEYMLKTGDIVFVRSNGSKELVGRNVLMQVDEPTTFSGFCIRCRLTNTAFNSVYLSYLLKAPSMRPVITNSGRGCNISNLNQKILSSLPIMRPSMSLQESFATRVSAIEFNRKHLNDTISALETLLASRLQYWFN